MASSVRVAQSKDSRRKETYVRTVVSEYPVLAAISLFVAPVMRCSYTFLGPSERAFSSARH